jgi:mono/diheme cytochrome c family protein
MRLTVPVLVAVLTSLTPGLGHAAPFDDPGAALYRRYCGACHGPGGRGDGAVAPALGEQPIDLTQLAKENDGTFPFERTARAIDGTTSVRAHGVSEMPVWGEVFHAMPDWPLERHIDARGKIVLITEYLRSIQAR